ncbi:MAG TPA: hypothetical protein VK048_02360 [Atopostipes sp.]|nr:hypothetical protein [Atopostipes sp.]
MKISVKNAVIGGLGVLSIIFAAAAYSKNKKKPPTLVRKASHLKNSSVHSYKSTNSYLSLYSSHGLTTDKKENK